MANNTRENDAVQALAEAARFTTATAKRYIHELRKLGWDVTRRRKSSKAKVTLKKGKQK